MQHITLWRNQVWCCVHPYLHEQPWGSYFKSFVGGGGRGGFVLMLLGVVFHSSGQMFNICVHEDFTPHVSLIPMSVSFPCQSHSHVSPIPMSVSFPCQSHSHVTACLHFVAVLRFSGWLSVIRLRMRALWTPGSTSYEVKIRKALIEQIRTELWF